jgi:hypothetical protein
MICECYRAEKNFVGKVGSCWGTAERDACSCGGDKSKCDFYPSVREKGKKPTTNADRIRAMTDEELATVIAWPYLTSPPWCSQHRTCPYISEDPTPCDKCALEWLKQEVDE